MQKPHEKDTGFTDCHGTPIFAGDHMFMPEECIRYVECRVEMDEQSGKWVLKAVDDNRIVAGMSVASGSPIEGDSRDMCERMNIPYG